MQEACIDEVVNLGSVEIGIESMVWWAIAWQKPREPGYLISAKRGLYSWSWHRASEIRPTFSELDAIELSKGFTILGEPAELGKPHAMPAACQVVVTEVDGKASENAESGSSLTGCR